MTGDAARIRLVERPSDAERNSVMEGLLAFNRAHLPHENYTPLAVLVKRRDGSPAGGLVGSVYWNALFVDLLWIADDVRGHGLGRAVMQEAEAYARSKGCGFVHLDTMSFQARGFYEKLGFSVYGTLTGYPNGIERYYMVKHFGALETGNDPL